MATNRSDGLFLVAVTVYFVEPTSLGISAGRTRFHRLADGVAKKTLVTSASDITVRSMLIIPLAPKVKRPGNVSDGEFRARDA